MSPIVYSVFSALFAIAACASGEDLPITGIANVGFRVSDIDKARAFYTGVLGFEEAFHLNDATGEARTFCFKVNDEQYYEIYPGLPVGENARCKHIAFTTPDIGKLRRMLAERGLAPGEVVLGADGDQVLELKDPDGTTLRFIQDMPGSLQSRARGRFNGERRIADRISHAGVIAADEKRAMIFYRDKLGFQEIWRGGQPNDTRAGWIGMRMPGASGQLIELMLYYHPPTRRELGISQHVGLEAPSTLVAYQQIVQRGLPPGTFHQAQQRMIQLFDPDGTRTEITQAPAKDAPQ